MTLSPDMRIAGVLAPLFALRGENDLGIGDVAALREFIGWIAGVGFKLVQLLPISEIGPDNSPYNAISAMAIEPTTLYLAPGSPQELTREEFDAACAEVELPQLRRGGVKYRRIKKLKSRLLEKAFANFSANASRERRTAFQQFCAAEATWLDDYAFFRALMEQNGDSPAWNRWPEKQRSLEKARMWMRDLSQDCQSTMAERQTFFRYVQWIAHEQWRETKSYAEAHGIVLMGDIPFGVSYYSADVFARPGEFALDWSGGAPPESHFKDDAFTQKWGQNWGIPLYRWGAMERNDFQWWRQRIRCVRRIFHQFRIDHVLGFYRIYAFPWRPRDNSHFLPLEHDQMLTRTGGRAPQFVPRDDETSDNREANRCDGEKYLRVVLQEAGANRVVGEDLGVVPEYVRPHLRSIGVAGFKIPQLETSDGKITSGDKYERLSVATYATHDHKPIRALWEEAFEYSNATSEQSRSELEKIASFAGLNRKVNDCDFEKCFYPASMEALFRSNAWITIVMITDLLARKYRFNVPGTKTKWNWSRRLQRTVAQFRASPNVRKRMRLIYDLLEKSGRLRIES